ncbi:hypothetical protein EJ02DRAFT_452238 [Clathrospora elynae]|uniref:Wax synthase domain-containing protein n=1 Tax=Clathrospora elynae TaxID=706981 RepID=A0A6A5SY33_9PLEO|nr:hypothetical protein EJ02DRAFT_452238 [Clathrospora elynae]
MFLLVIPVGYAFLHSGDIAPNYTVCDTFARFSYIWLAHMSFELCVLEYSPVVSGAVTEKGKWAEGKERVRQAYKVLFDRNHTQVLEARAQTTRADSPLEAEPTLEQNIVVTDKKTDEPIVVNKQSAKSPHQEGYAHGQTYWQFVRYHALKAALLFAAQAAYSTYEELYSPLRINPSYFTDPNFAFFFRRFPKSLHYEELYYRFETILNWNIVSMWLYESYHSVFALLFVGLGFDRPEEWSKSLFGPLSEAWSVRRYWGKHWHNYIYHSFSGHVKVVTRGWLGFPRGALGPRLVENTLVFLLSGLMHSLVRWQQDPETDYWAISLWYVGQMLPIILETLLVSVWRNLRLRLGIEKDNKLVDRLEFWFGHAWTTAWFMWSVPKYIHTRLQWTDARLQKKYAAEWSDDDFGGNGTGIGGVDVDGANVDTDYDG